MIHHGPVGGADGWDNEGVLRTFGGDDFKGIAVFAWGDVVEVGIATIKESRNASGFNVADDLAVFLAVDFEIGIAGQRWNRDDGGIELLGCDW